MKRSRVNYSNYKKKKKNLLLFCLIVFILSMCMLTIIVRNVNLKICSKKDVNIYENQKVGKKAKNNIKQKVYKNENKSSKIAYLTFDDGPSSKITPQILEVLDKYDVKATFFVIGHLAEQNSDLIKTMNKKGHAIGNHTYSHKYKVIYSNVDNFIKDVNKCNQVLKNILGDNFDTKLVRFPGGSFGDKRKPFREAIVKENYKYVDWNALNGDAEGQDICTSRLIQRLKQTTKGKNKVIILMHDAKTKSTTVKALPQILEYLKKEGYEFKVCT